MKRPLYKPLLGAAMFRLLYIASLGVEHVKFFFFFVI